MNKVIKCPRCGELIPAHVQSLKWIRCPRCHKGVEVAPNIVEMKVVLKPKS